LPDLVLKDQLLVRWGHLISYLLVSSAVLSVAMTPITKLNFTGSNLKSYSRVTIDTKIQFRNGNLLGEN
jgi:hypothetical protein